MHDQDEQIDDAERDVVRRQVQEENEAEAYDEVALAAERVRSYLDAPARESHTHVLGWVVGDDEHPNGFNLTVHDLRVLLAAIGDRS